MFCILLPSIQEDMEAHRNDTEVDTMPHRWPDDTDYILWELDVLDRDCASCGRMMHVCDHRYRRFFTLEGPVKLVCKLNHCPDPDCPGHAKTKSPEIGAVDRAARVGHRVGRLLLDRASAVLATLVDPPDLSRTGRLLRHQAQRALYRPLHPALSDHARRAPAGLRGHAPAISKGSMTIILTIDGLQPEKGHETLYVVRELTRKRVWFAEALISATEEEVRRLIAQAKRWAESLGKRVVLWMSDKQDAFLEGDRGGIPGRAAPLLR